MSELSMIEQETIITYNRKEDFVEIATRIPRDIAKLKKLEKIGEAELIDVASGYVRYTIPKKNFSWHRKRRLSEKAKQSLAANFKKEKFPTQ